MMQLTRSDFAALRAWVQGLPVEWVASRYLPALLDDEGLPPDARVVASHLAVLRETLLLRAQQHGLIELAAALEGRAPGSNRAMDRAVDAITQLERLGTPSPRPDHSVSMWFAPALASRLRRAGLSTLDELVRHCNRRGAAWWRAVPRVGLKASRGITTWMRQHGGALVAAGGQTIAPYAVDGRTLAAAVEISPGVVRVPPWEAMQLPSALDGSAGTNRGGGSHALAARNDYEAVQAWLSRWPTGSHTHRAYRKEAERFIAWAVIARERALSSLLVEDCIAYRDFLADPQPQRLWCGPMQPRFSPLWRPFTGPLSPRSRAYAITVLRSLCEWLTRLRYLAVNPFDGLPQNTAAAATVRVDRALSKSAWEDFEAWLRTRAAHDDGFRTAHAAVVLLRDTGLRRAELCAADRGRAQAVADAHAAVWGELQVSGKGGKERVVPLSTAAVSALRAHWRDRGEDFDTATCGPLLRPLRRPQTPRSLSADAADRGFSPTGLHALVARVAKAYAGERPQHGEVAELRAHALRHTLGVLATEAGVPADVLQAIFGHASPTTTSLYNRAPRARRLREAARLYAGD